MDSSTENIDQAVLQEAGDTVEISGEWSVTGSALNSSDTTSSNPYINIDTLKECCADSSDILNEKTDFMVVESTATKYNADESKNLTMCKTSAFQKKHKSSFNNMSHMFENLLDDDTQIEESIYLNRFQKRKRLLPPNEEDFVEINKSDYSESDSVDVCMQSSKSKFKHPSNFSLINASTNSMDESKTEILSQKFTRRTIDLVNSAFDNVINDSSIMSSNESNNKNTTLIETSVSNLNRNSLCDTAEVPSLNHTYNVPVNSTQVGLLSQSIKMYSELSNIEQPINETTYTLENELRSNNESLGSLKAKNTLSETFTIESNLNDTSTQLKSGLKSSKTISTLTDMSNIYNQSKSSVRKPNFIRKLQLDEGSQEYNISIHGGDNSTVNDEMNQEDNIKSKRFKLNKIHPNVNSIIFDNVITSDQRNEISTTDTISKTLNAPVETSKNNDFLNISSGPNLKENVEDSVNKSTTQQSNLHQNKFIENNKNISDLSLLLKSNKSNSFSQRSSKFNFSKQFGRLSLSYHENSFHDVSVPQNTTCMLSQSQGPHFVGKKNLYAHSGVFNNIIDNSLDSNITLSVSKEVKFKNHKNISEGDSLMFENVIRSSQESNSTFTRNKTLSRSVIYDQSKIQAYDEISLYANANDLTFDEKCSRYSDNSLKKHEISKILNIKESECLENELKNDRISIRFSKQNNNSFTNNTINKSMLSNNIDESKEKNNMKNISIRSSRTSERVAYSNNESAYNNEINDSELSVSSESSIDSEKTSNDTSMLEIGSNDGTISNDFSKQSNNSFANNQPAGSRTIDELSKNNKSSSSKVTRLSSASLKKNKSLPNETLTKNELSISKNNMYNTSTRSSRTSKSVAYSNIESAYSHKINDSELSVSSESSIDSEKTSNVTSMLEIGSNDGTISNDFSKQSNTTFANDQLAGSRIIDELSKNNKSSNTGVTRLSSVSMKINKSFPNETVTGNELSISINNVSNISTRSSRSSKSFAYSNNESADNNKINDSEFSISSETCTDAKKTFNDISMLEIGSNDGTISNGLSKQSNNSFANDQSTGSKIIDELSKNNKSSSSKVTRLSSASLKKNKSLPNKIISVNKSLISENNGNNMLTYSPKISKSVAFSNRESATNDETYDSGSVLWTTLSGSSIDSEKTSSNTLILEDVNSINEISTHLSKQNNNTVPNELPAVSSNIDELPEKYKLPSTKLTSLSSASMKNNKSLNNTVLDNKSVASDNNENKISTRSSMNVTHSNTENIDNEADDSIFWTTVSGRLTDSRKSSNNISTLDDLNNIGSISTSMSKPTNDLSVVSSIIDELPENKSSSSKLTRLSSMSVKNNKSLNNTVLNNESMASDNNVSIISTRSSMNVTHSNTENIDSEANDSIFWTTVSGRSTDFRKSSNNISTFDDLNNIGSISTSMSKPTNNSFANDLSVVSSIIDELPENNKSSSSKLTRLSSMSVKNNKSLNNTVLDNKSVASDNNENKISTRFSMNVIHSNTENINNEVDDSIFWTTVSGRSTDSRKSSNNISTIDNLNNIGSISTSMSKQTNDLSVVSSIIDELPENKSSSSKLTRLSSMTVKNNKSSLNKTDLNNESVASDNIINKISSRSSKNVTHFNTEKTDGSVFWTTVSGCFTDSRKTSNNLSTHENLNNISSVSTSMSKQTISSFTAVSSNIDKLPNNNEKSSTRVTRSSSKLIKKNKSLVSQDNTKYISTRSSRTSKSLARSNDGNVDGTDNSMDWTTVPDNSSSELPIQNEFLTPTNTKLAIKERIINTIGIMSANKLKSTHPGAFELEKNLNGPLTRSFPYSSNHSPSILTRVLVANNTSELASSFTGNISIDQSQIEMNVKEKFKSLYNKESWITKRLYNFLVSKLQLKYDIYSVKYAEKFVKYLASVLKRVYKDKVDLQLYADMIRYHMARYGIIEDTSDYLRFLTDFIPRPYYDRLMPGWNLETSDVKFDPQKYFIPIMEDEEFLKKVLENLNNT